MIKIKTPNSLPPFPSSHYDLKNHQNIMHTSYLEAIPSYYKDLNHKLKLSYLRTTSKMALHCDILNFQNEIKVNINSIASLCIINILFALY